MITNRSLRPRTGGCVSRAIPPSRRPATPLRGHRFHLPGTLTTHLPGRRVGPDIRSPPRGGRYRLSSLLALCVVAVLGGDTSLAAISHFAADTDSDLREQLGLTSSTPNASTPRRLLTCLDGGARDDAVGAWLARYAADPVDESGDTLVRPAVDSKTVRGSRPDGAAVHLPGRRTRRLPDRDRPAPDPRERRGTHGPTPRSTPSGDRQLPAVPASVSRAAPGHVQDLSGRSRTHAGFATHSCDLSSPPWTRRDCHTLLPCCAP
ncbi:transposase family protein [Streptomyces hokutonensis]|uniref:transposase family protein n=1 Tax=Streptomyces hokutonensis TaxID=1306990 RepID=UPI0033FD7A24